MSHNITPDENQATLARLFATLEAKGDGKCYCPWNRCKGFKRRRLLIRITEKHCRENGHVEGGHEYHPMVSYSLNVFIILIVFANVSMLTIEEKERILLFFMDIF